MRHGELVPAAIAPHAVHGIHHFDGVDIFVQQEITVVRRAYLSLFVIGAGFVVEVRDFTVHKREGPFQFFLCFLPSI